MEAAALAPDFELSQVRVRLICAGERVEWDTLMRAHHYLGLTALVGRSLRYVAEVDGRWLALLGWASPALKCASRDAWIGWSPTLQWQRLALIANNSRFLILPGVRVKNLASRILGLNLARLSQDWLDMHGHRLLLAETFIDPARFAGTCYRAANWIELGSTRGFAKSNATYTEHGTPKRIWVFPLHRLARCIFFHRRSTPAAAPSGGQDDDAERCRCVCTVGSSAEPARPARWPRRCVTISAGCSPPSCVRSSVAPRAVPRSANGSSVCPSRCCAGCAADARPTAATSAPASRPSGAGSKRSMSRTLNSSSGTGCKRKAMRTSPWRWMARPCAARANKAGRPNNWWPPSQHHSHVVMNQVEIPDKASEMRAVKPLLDSIPLAGRVVTADALHTQVETARYLVEDKQAHYLFTVKDNQPTLKCDIASLQMEASPP